MEAQIVGWVALGVSICGTIIGIINHKQIRSTCCGRTADISLDITDTIHTTQVASAPSHPPPRNSISEESAVEIKNEK